MMINDFITDREAFRKSLDLDDFIEEARQIVKDYKCPLCEGIYLNPVVDNCGHVFCKTCINRFLESHEKCPFSGWKLEEKNIQKLMLIGDILEKQTVFCKNRHFHCEWLGKLSELDNHLNTDCRRQVIRCPHQGCENSIFREDLPDHTAACEWRIVSCADCHILTPFIEVKSHQENCPRFKVPCPQLCKLFIERQEINTHVQDVCMNTVTLCPYSEIGCTNKIAKKDLNDYMTNNINRHNLMFISHFRGFRNQIMNGSLNFYGPYVSILEEKILNCESQISLIQNRLNNFEKFFNINKDEHGTPSKDLTQSKNHSKIEEEKLDKMMSRKRPRPDDDDPLKVSKDVINLNEIPAIENTTPLTQMDLPNVLQDNNSVSPCFHNEKLEISFDKINISKGLVVTNNKVLLANTTKLEHKYAFMNQVLNDQNVEWKVQLNVSSNWAGVGVCCKETVINNKYKFITSNSSYYNGTFAISTNGYSWNCNDSLEHNVNIPGFLPIIRGEVIHFKYCSETKELVWSIGSKLQGKLSNVTASKGMHLVPCIILLHIGDEMIAELI